MSLKPAVGGVASGSPFIKFIKKDLLPPWPKMWTFNHGILSRYNTRCPLIKYLQISSSYSFCGSSKVVHCVGNTNSLIAVLVNSLDIIFVSVEVQTRDSWLRSADATTVLSRPLILAV